MELVSSGPTLLAGLTLKLYKGLFKSVVRVETVKPLVLKVSQVPDFIIWLFLVNYFLFFSILK